MESEKQSPTLINDVADTLREGLDTLYSASSLLELHDTKTTRRITELLQSPWKSVDPGSGCGKTKELLRNIKEQRDHIRDWLAELYTLLAPIDDFDKQLGVPGGKKSIMDSIETIQNLLKHHDFK